MKKLIPFFFLILFVSPFVAQDVHLTQWFAAPQIVNPAFAGLKEKSLEAGLIYRNQWQNVPVGYNSMVLFASTDLPKDKWNGFCFGTTYTHDIAGASRYTTDQFNLSFGYKKFFLDKRLLTSLALQPNFKTIGFNTNDLLFGKNYDGEKYNAALNSGEVFVNQRSSVFSMNSGFSVRYSFNQYLFNVGYARYYDAGKTRNAFDNNLLKTSRRQNILLGLQYQASKQVTYQVQSAVYLINKQKEWISAIGLAYQPSLKKHEIISSNLIYRNKDAIAINFSYEKNQWQGFMAYDFNISEYSIATKYQGGFELGIKYLYHYPKIIQRKYKQCVIYL
jgi:type IX secretion system PorP/SprF family membrane protein